MRKLAFLVPLLFVATIPVPAATPTPVRKTTKPVKKKVAQKTAHKKRHRPPVVYVSPQVRHVAFQAVSARATHPMTTLDGAGALVPFFEQISRPSETGSLHILHLSLIHI